ncbi:MAG TPA: histone deacetylase family protein [Acidimicrobiia bacterium]|jgi:acetoin utilization deacetylase AcuC-like enzyme
MTSAERLDMATIWSDVHRLHVPGGEVWVGVRIEGTDVPKRADAIRDAVAAAGSPLVEATPHDDSVLAEIHDRALLDYMASIWGEWEASGYLEDPGQDRVVPYAFPIPGVVATNRVPWSPGAKAGWFAMDTTTLIGPGTHRAAIAAVDTALTAVDVVTEGAPGAYALCRPPGHHAGRSFYGGSCYLNSAAAAAAALARVAGPVAIVDIDAHHGNGTQHIFYERGDVFYGSVHVDPAAGWFPHFAGFSTEAGVGDGAGANHNFPVPPGSADDVWLAAVERICLAAESHRPAAVVVSLGVDAAVDDPESPLRITGDGYRRAGAMISGLGVPTVFVQEGGYHLETLGGLVVGTLAGYESGRGGS